MRTHADIDRRSLMLARAVAERIDSDPQRRGLEHARMVCERWMRTVDSGATREWREILKKPWEDVRAVLLDESETGKRLRQSTPFCGILSPRRRWEIYKKAGCGAQIST